MNPVLQSLIWLAALTAAASAADMPKPNVARQVSQYGITWTFDRPCIVGRFVSGDWWVTGPSENQPGHGREVSRIVSIAGLMLLLDVPRERKERLMIG
jgi:hypothetical protein